MGPLQFFAHRLCQSGSLVMTHNPSTTVGGHVTVDLDWLALVPSQVDGVQAGGGVAVEQRLGAVFGVPVQHAGFTTHNQTQQSV